FLFHVDSDTQITVQAPGGSGSVVVTAPCYDTAASCGSSPESPAAMFRELPAPAVYDVSPGVGSVVRPTAVRIIGTGLASATAASFNTSLCGTVTFPVSAISDSE